MGECERSATHGCQIWLCLSLVSVSAVEALTVNMNVIVLVDGQGRCTHFGGEVPAACHAAVELTHVSQVLTFGHF